VRRTEAVKTLGLAAASVLVALLLTEAAVRLVEPREVLREHFQTPDPVLHHRFVPGARGFHKTAEFTASYAINSLGLRDREVSRAKPPGTRRILLLGDSFTEGNGVEAAETFAARLQALVDAAGTGGRWEVINAGVGSYSPLLEYLYLKNGGLDLGPDLVILNLDLSDVYDDIQYTRRAVFDTSGEPLAVRPEPEPRRGRALGALVAIKDFFKRHTRTYNFVRRRLAGVIESGRQEARVSADVAVDKYAMLRDAAPPDDRAFALTYSYLRRTRDLLAARGIPLWVAVYPYGLQVSAREWAGGRRFWGFEAGRTYGTRPQELIAARCREEGIPVVNMTPAFVEAARRTHPLYFEDDGHWRPAGHEVAARALFEALHPYLRDGAATAASSTTGP
jgi:lysophospholipase L1-like esterase